MTKRMDELERELEFRHETLRFFAKNRRDARMARVREAIDVVLKAYRRLAELDPRLEPDMERAAEELVARFRKPNKNPRR